MLVQDAMVYLVRKESTSLDLLRSWKSRLVNVLDDNPTGEVAAAIAYAVYTLILKNHGKTDETGILSSILPQYMERIHHWYAQSYPEGAPVWERGACFTDWHQCYFVSAIESHQHFFAST
jgi:isocitrate dehydrogenase kinase/phosphatase